MMPVFITQPVKIIITDISTKMNVLENGVVIGIIAVGQTAVKQKAFPAVGMVMQLFIIQMQAALFYKNKKVRIIKFMLRPADAVQTVTVEQSAVITIEKIFQSGGAGSVKMHDRVSVDAFFLIEHGIFSLIFGERVIHVLSLQYITDWVICQIWMAKGSLIVSFEK